MCVLVGAGCSDPGTEGGELVTDEVAPTVDILSPADGATVMDTVTVQVDARDAFEVASLELRVDGDSVMLSTSAPPWSWDWDTSATGAGPHTISAHVYDAAGNEGVAEIAVEVEVDPCAGDCPPSEVIWLAPQPGFVTGEVTLEAAGTDDRGVAQIRYFVDGAELGRADGPFAVTWDSGGATEGAHTLTAVVVDTSGQEAEAALEVHVDRTPPTVLLDTPEGDDVVADFVTFGAAVSDLSGVAAVTVSVGLDVRAEPGEAEGRVEGQIDTSGLEAGSYLLAVAATDGVGLIGEATRTFVVDRPPTVRFVSPEPGSTVLDAVTLEIDATDDVGLAAVAVFEGQTLVGEVVDGNLDWDPGFGAGPRELIARAEDTRGQVTEARLQLEFDRPFPLDVLLCAEACEPLTNGAEVFGAARLRPVTDLEVATLVGATAAIEGETVAMGEAAPFDLLVDTSVLEDGEYTLTVMATSADDFVATVERTIWVNNCDRDNDGADSMACGGADCDDTEAGFRPGAPDFVGDDLDQNCDGLDGEDGDGDGHASLDSGGGDCDDADTEVYPCPSDALGECSDRVTDNLNCGGCGMRCELGLDCEEAECTCARPECEEGTPRDYDFQASATFYHSIVIEVDDTVGIDVDDDGEIDNRFGPLLQALGEVFGGNANATIAFLIGRGDLLMGSTWPGLEGPVEDADDVTVDFFDLIDVDANPRTSDRFRADAASFLPDTATPRSRFARGSVTDGVYTAGPAPVFRMIFPLGNVPLPLVVTRAQINAAIATDENGIAVMDATVGGAIPYEDLIEALNAYLRSPICSCLGLEEPLITGGRFCTGEFTTDACRSPTQEVCGAIASNCGLLVPILRGQTDIDLDGDRRADSYSVFIHLAGSGTLIEGLAEE